MFFLFGGCCTQTFPSCSLKSVKYLGSFRGVQSTAHIYIYIITNRCMCRIDTYIWLQIPVDILIAFIELWNYNYAIKYRIYIYIIHRYSIYIYLNTTIATTPHSYCSYEMLWSYECSTTLDSPRLTSRNSEDRFSVETPEGDEDCGVVNTWWIRMLIYVDLPCFFRWWLSLVMFVYQR